MRNNPRVTWQSSSVSLWSYENLPEGQPSLQHSTNQAFLVEWLNGSHSSPKGTWQPTWSLPEAPKGLSDHEKQDSLVWWNQNWTFWPEYQASCFFSSRDGVTSPDRGKDECRKVHSDPWWKPAPEPSGPQTEAKIHLTMRQRPKTHSQENKGVAAGQVCECPWVAQPEPRSKSCQTSLERAEIAVHRCFPSNLKELGRIYKEECEKMPTNRCAKRVASYWSWSCNRCQWCCNTVLGYGCEHICKMTNLCQFNNFLHIFYRPVFTLSLRAIVCRCLRQKMNLIYWRISL